MQCEGKLSILESKGSSFSNCLSAKGASLPVGFLSISGFRRNTDNGVNNTGNVYVELHSGFVKAASHFALPLNLATCLATGDWAWLQSSQS